MRVLAALSLAAMVLASGRAAADVVYAFHETSATGFLGTLPPGDYVPRLVVTDAAYASGALDFSQTCAFAFPASCTATGDMSGFASLTDASPGFGDRSIDISFGADRTLSGSIVERGEYEDLSASGTRFSWTGTLLSDRYPGCGAAAPCSFAGYWYDATAISEPGTLPLLATALGVLALVRLKRRVL